MVECFDAFAAMQRHSTPCKVVTSTGIRKGSRHRSVIGLPNGLAVARVSVGLKARVTSVSKLADKAKVLAS